MKKKRTYSTVDVERFDLLALIQLLTVGCIVAVDVAKTKFVAAIATATGEVLRLVRFEHPRQTLTFLAMLETLRERKLEPRVVMEPTGTYGDALRHQCHERNVPVHMMSPKHTHDFAEVLDGVPSMHDPKAAMVLARLAVIKETKAWKPDSEEKREVRALLDRRWPLSKTHELYHGHLEAALARHWPELASLIDVRQQRSWMKLLQQHPGPQAVAARSEAAAETLRMASRGRLGAERIAAIVGSARTTLGVPMTSGEQTKLRFIVEEIEHQAVRIDAVDQELAKLIGSDKVMSKIAVAVGPACSAAIMSHVGSPLDFPCASALEKAIGLNLKQRSSGEKKGQLTITKRGSGQVRQLIYLATLRLVQEDPIVAAWYRARSSYRSGKGNKKAIVAVMRKITRALWYVARGAAFDASKLFDVRRLDLPVAPSDGVAEKESSHEDMTNAARQAPRPVRAQKSALPNAAQKQPSKGGVSQQLA